MKISRRNLIVSSSSLIALCGLGMFALPRFASTAPLLRPPGALTEKKFLATCIKCGQCLQVCPYHSIELFDMEEGIHMGTPVITPSKRGCYLCDLLPCVLSCPSGALDHAVSDALDVNMGKAEIAAPARCLALSGAKLSADDIADIKAAKPVKTEVERELFDKLDACVGVDCDICVRFCPYPDTASAIGLESEESGGMLPVIRDKCVGCGVCEELCPTKVIATVPRG